MSEFEFAFSLFGLILGLALAEGLGGLARALKASHRVRIGWLTALLGIFVSCDVVTFWVYTWSMRELLSFNWPTLFAGFVVTPPSTLRRCFQKCPSRSLHSSGSSGKISDAET